MNGQILAQNMSRMFSERMRLGLTRKDTATAVKVSERAIKKFEEGICYPTKGTYNKLAKFFNWEVWQ
jgi:transcriptional regulator with XRE-family HTH domain